MFIEHFTYIGIFCLLILGGLGLPFPEDGVLITSGLLIAHGVIKLAPAVLIIYPSLLIADFLLYSIGRKYGRMTVEHKRFSKIVSPVAFSILEQKFARWGALMVFFGRHFVGFRVPIFLISGVLRIPRTKFLIADGLSAIITVCVTLGLGYVGGNALMVLKKDITRVNHILILLLIILAVGWMILRYFKDRKKYR
ncbi:MAG: SNARE associated Golgi protein [Syntrophorhabdus sp. PtaU1.Bin153]|nr:MAG: SNARE associated Golgi protein [Syntrophorhabdus sp. PtaU1.Bin153]